MKKIIALILASFTLQSQTLIKLKQLENSTAGSVITTTGVGVPTWTNTLPASAIPTLTNYITSLIGSPSTTITTTLYGDDIQVIFPSTYSTSGSPLKLAIYAHGNGGTYTQYPNTDFKDSLLSRGYVVATASAKLGYGSGNGWGNSFAQTQYSNLYEYCVKNLNVRKNVYLIGQSMGALTCLNLIHTKAFPVIKYVSLMGVISIDSAYQRNSKYTQFKSGIELAYNFTGSTTVNQSKYGFDPFRRLKRLATDTIYETMPPVYFLHGSADTVASFPTARQFYRIIKNSNQNTTFSVVAGGVHSSSLPSSAIIGNIMNWMADTYTFTDVYTPNVYNYFSQVGTTDLAYTTGSINIGNAANTGQRVLRIGQGTGWTDIGNATNGTGNGFISFNQTTNALENGALFGGAFSTFLNSNTQAGIRISNANILNCVATGIFNTVPVSINKSSVPVASAALEVESTTKGFLPPRMTATQASAISSPAEGLIVYVTNTNGTFTAKGWWGYNGAAWEKLNN